MDGTWGGPCPRPRALALRAHALAPSVLALFACPASGSALTLTLTFAHRALALISASGSTLTLLSASGFALTSGLTSCPALTLTLTSGSALTCTLAFSSCRLPRPPRARAQLLLHELIYARVGRVRVSALVRTLGWSYRHSRARNARGSRCICACAACLPVMSVKECAPLLRVSRSAPSRVRICRRARHARRLPPRQWVQTLRGS